MSIDRKHVLASWDRRRARRTLSPAWRMGTNPVWSKWISWPMMVANPWFWLIAWCRDLVERWGESLSKRNGELMVWVTWRLWKSASRLSNRFLRDAACWISLPRITGLWASHNVSAKMSPIALWERYSLNVVSSTGRCWKVCLAGLVEGAGGDTYWGMGKSPD